LSPSLKSLGRVADSIFSKLKISKYNPTPNRGLLLMTITTEQTDVLCVGHASYDLIFCVCKHPEADEKLFADQFIRCGGGPAANAAVLISKLGFKAAFSGYLGHDIYGNLHVQELQQHHIDTRLLVRGSQPTPVSTILVKPDGKRALINYKGDTPTIRSDRFVFSEIHTKTLLFDGHEPDLSLALIEWARRKDIPTILDAGSLHTGTSALMDKVDYLVCSEKFALQYAGHEEKALNRMAATASSVVITLGERGIIWHRHGKRGALPAYPIQAIDTTGAGDAFHGAFAAAVCANMDWLDILKYATAAGAFCCTRMGARHGLPDKKQHTDMLACYNDFLQKQAY